LRDEFCPICGYERTVYHDAQHVIELHVMLLSDLSPRGFNTEERKQILNETCLLKHFRLEAFLHICLCTRDAGRSAVTLPLSETLNMGIML